MTDARGRETILSEADRIVNGQRREDYGGPFDSFSDIAAGWSMVLGVQVTPEQVGLCMIQLKVARAKNGGFHRDSFVDIAGYAQCMEFVAEHRASRGEMPPGVGGPTINIISERYSHGDPERVCERVERSDGKGAESAWITVFDRGNARQAGLECHLNHDSKGDPR